LEAAVTPARKAARTPNILFAIVIGLGLTTFGCSTTPSDSMGEFQGAIYVEGFLIAGRGVDSVFVGTTVPLYESYSRTTSGIADALVTIQVDDTTQPLAPLTGSPGYYHLPQLQIQSGKTYHLAISIDDVTLQAQTTVPAPPVVSASSGVLTYTSSELAVTWTGDSEGGYVTTRGPVVLGEPIPLELQLGGGKGGFGGFGGAIDTTGFSAMRDSIAAAEQWQFVQRESAQLNWGLFTRYGTYSYAVLAIDANYADYLISSRQDTEVLDEPNFHVTGGIGIFASMAADTLLFTVSE
jgi:hypothetical protein